jgi:hypothetical protein
MTDRTTKQRLAIWIALPLFLGTAIVVGLLFVPMGAPGNEPPWFGRSALPYLQAEASEACKCARAATDPNGKKSCWTEFENKTKNRTSEFVSACDPISPRGICFGSKGEACVVVEYSSRSEYSFCTQDEARIVEAGMEKAMNAGEQDEDAVLRRFYEQFRRGRSVQNVGAASDGCAG